MNTTQVFLEGQRNVIISQLSKAKTLILVAMAYFTDEHLFRILLKKALEGVKVHLIVRDDEINIMSGIDYGSLKNVNGDFCYNKDIHHKFCVIDGITVLSGSYNWTNQARRNHEDLTLIDGDLLVAGMYMVKFFKIKDPAHFIKRSLLKDAEYGHDRESRRAERRNNNAAKMEQIRKAIAQKNAATVPPKKDDSSPSSS
jgi:phosphatidylserine/phosphatidylglycerophosphate/cardiolipin synthase-like enzyme